MRLQRKGSGGRSMTYSTLYHNCTTRKWRSSSVSSWLHLLYSSVSLRLIIVSPLVCLEVWSAQCFFSIKTCENVDVPQGNYEDGPTLFGATEAPLVSAEAKTAPREGCDRLGLGCPPTLSKNSKKNVVLGTRLGREKYRWKERLTGWRSD